MSETFYDFDKPLTTENYRWIQPPLIAYLVSTCDKYGNNNVTPATLGTLICAREASENEGALYYFSFSLLCSGKEDNGVVSMEPRHGFLNLERNKECVISYVGYEQADQSIVCNMPIPYGIDEAAVAGFTPLPSRKVQPAGIRECAVNMEAVVEHSWKLGNIYQHYICRVVGLSVHNNMIKKDEADPLRLGIMHIDPVFETAIMPTEESSAIRLYYTRMDHGSTERTSDSLGCTKEWVGTFEMWMDSEFRRGKITLEEKQKAVELHSRWKKDRNPAVNKTVKDELTALLRKICIPQH